ncbi:hypothetical protein ACFTAO_01165 [Paenibacillus rhizoplanae]
MKRLTVTAVIGVVLLCVVVILFSNRNEEEIPVQHQKPPDAAVTIDGNVRYQTIDNFGASDAWSMDPPGEGVDRRE